MTENEAKGKWCPLLAIGRGLTNEQHHCVGSRCMFWTPTDNPTEEKSTSIEESGEKAPPTKEPAAPEGDGWKKVGDLRRHDAVVYRPRRDGTYNFDGPYTTYYQKWERPRDPEMREGDCSLTQ